MHIVARHLQIEARKRPSDVEADSFARSAFNRYYYATFLCVRENISSINPNWARLSHKSYPDLLKGSIKKDLNNLRSRAVRTGDSKLIKDCQASITAALYLADLMEKAYSVRVVADYNPEIKVNFELGERFKISEITITEAHEWLDRADSWVQNIVSVLRQGNV